MSRITKPTDTEPIETQIDEHEGEGNPHLESAAVSQLYDDEKARTAVDGSNVTVANAVAANEAGNANQLGGQPPSYYESGTEFVEITSSTTWTVPADAEWLFVWLIGGGGGGSQFVDVGGGGGAGGAASVGLFRADTLDSLDITIGAGGAGVYDPSVGDVPGEDGGDTSIGDLMIAPGGGGGRGGNNGGTATSPPGYYHLHQFDESDTVGPSDVNYLEGGIGPGRQSAGDNGGRSYYGGGGGAESAATAGGNSGGQPLYQGADVTPGAGGGSYQDGEFPGGGGGGGSTSEATDRTGDGADGVCWIWWW